MMRFIILIFIIIAVFMGGKACIKQIKYGSDNRFNYEFERVFFEYDTTKNIEKQSEIWYKYITNHRFTDDMNKLEKAGKSEKDIVKFSNGVETCIKAHVEIAEASKETDGYWTRKLIHLVKYDFNKYAAIEIKNIH